MHDMQSDTRRSGHSIHPVDSVHQALILQAQPRHTLPAQPGGRFPLRTLQEACWVHGMHGVVVLAARPEGTFTSPHVERAAHDATNHWQALLVHPQGLGLLLLRCLLAGACR